MIKNLINKFKKEEKEIEIENKTERILTNTEKKAIIIAIKLSQQAIKQLKKKVIENQKDKEAIIKCLESYSQMMDIEDEKGKPYTKQDYQEMTGAELTQLLWEAQQYAAKNLLTKEETQKIFGKENE